MNNNPFENDQPRRDDLASAQNSMNAKPNSPVKIVLAIIIGIIAVTVALSSIDFSPKEVELELSDYVYDYQDLFLSDYDMNFDPYPSVLPQGTEFKMSSDSEKFVETRDGSEATYIVGIDIEPGIYSLTLDGEAAWVSLDLGFTNASSHMSQEFYNIPLYEGDVVFIENHENKYSFEYTLVPQTEYVLYQEGLNGIFVYGLTYFYTEIIFETGYDEVSDTRIEADVCNYNFTRSCDTGPSIKHESQPGSFFKVTTEIY